MLNQLHIKLIILSFYLRCKFLRRFRNRQSLQRWQHKQIKKAIKALPKDNYYRQRLPKDIDFDDWASWPTIDKKEMMKNFDSLNTLGIKKEDAFDTAIKAEQSRNFLPQIGDITVGLSSGTSGHRGLFVVSQKERYGWVGVLLAKMLKKSILKHQKVALFLRANSQLYETLNNGSIEFRFFDMITPVKGHIAELNQFHADILIAPPSVLRQLAEFKISGELSAQPEQLYSAAEVLDPIDEVNIAQAFAQPVGQIYQATEGFLGITCAYGSLHLNEDVLIIEKHYVNKEERKFYPVISDFSRVSQPILRYQLNDILTESDKPCACGSVNTVISMIEGRSDDMIQLHPRVGQQDLEPVMIFPDFIRQAILRATQNLEEYRVNNNGVGSLEIGLRYKEGYQTLQDTEASISEALKELAYSQDCMPPQIRFSQCPDLSSMGLTKLKRIQRSF